MTAEVVELEECSFRAWPAREVIHLDGWVLRFADGYTRRANSANPLGPIGGDPRERIRHCETLFRERELRPVFKMTPAARPGNLDEVLAAEGYALEAPTRVQTRDLAARPPLATPPMGLELLARPGDSWFDVFARWVRVGSDRHGAHRAILESIEPALRCAILHGREGPLACGLAVCDGPRVGLYDLVTAPEERRKGHGTRLVEGLLAWGIEEGAQVGYLQVMEENETARRLYHRLGFADAYPYWYRVRSRARA